MATAPQQPPQQPPPSNAAGVPGTVGATVAGPAAGDVAAAVAAAKAAEIPSSVARASAEAVILGALVAYIARKRQADGEFLRQQIAARVPRIQPDDVQRILVEEQRRDEAFAVKQAQRVSDDVRRILQIADPAEREKQMQAMLDREQRYTEQRAEAMASRAIAAADREDLRIDSPQGAFWLLGIAKEHTAGCVTGETLIAGPKPRRGFRRDYAGQLCEIMVASGEVLRITPNHPVLTPTGWRAAGLLREGDQLLRDGAAVERNRWAVEYPRHAEATIEQVFESIKQLPSAVCAAHRVKRLDFHGDFADADVHVVAADRRLLLDHGSVDVQRVREQLLVGGNPAGMPGSPQRRPLGAFLGEGRPAERTRSRAHALGIRGSRRRVHRGECKTDSLTVAATDLNASIEQDALQSLARDAKLLGEPLDGMTGAVTLDHVVKVRHFDWAGQVYNLSTRGGWYIANGLIVQNCLAMRDRFWPWEVLDRVHPPRHPGCTSYLIGYHDAIARDLMKPTDVMDVQAAIARASGIVMEFDAEAGRELAALSIPVENENGLREALIHAGLTTPEAYDAAVNGSA